MRRRLLPESATSAVRRVVLVRTIRGFADGFVAVLIARYLLALGFSPARVGVVITGTLLGSAVLTLGFGFSGHRVALPTLLVSAAVLMAATGVGFATVTSFWPLFAVAAVGTLNPTGGDVSVFLPTEQALVTGEVPAADRPRLFAVYNLSGAVAGAFGALASALPDLLVRHSGWSTTAADRLGFAGYGLVGVVTYLVYRRLRSDEGGRPAPVGVDPRGGARSIRDALATSRRTVLELAGLFSIDSAGSGFVGTSILVLWLHLRFDLSAGATASVFFAAGLLGGASQLLAPRLAARFGFIRTMVFTHLPANGLLILAAFSPNGGVAIGLLLVRALFAQMDVPARQSFVMAVVPAEERTAAASVTNVPRSLTAASTPWIAGLLLDHSTFGWPLLVAGATKISYDLLLLVLYRNVPEHAGAARRPT